MKSTQKVLAVAFGFFVTSGASATTNWTLAVANGGVTSAVDSQTNATTSLTISGWANTGAPVSGSLYQAQNQASGAITEQTLNTNSAMTGSAAVNNFGTHLYAGGVGITNFDACGGNFAACGVGDSSEGAQPEHAIDNNQRYEMVMLQFGTKVNLTSASFGYVSGDSDYTVLAYTGPVNGQSIGGKNWADLGTGVVNNTTNGWTLIANCNGNTSTGTKNIDTSACGTVAATTYSSFWLIGAYNPLGGGASALGSVADNFKLASVTGTLCNGTQQCGGSNVPEPGSLALLSLGLFGILRSRKTKKQ